MANADRTVPLLPRRRLVGLSFGGLTSARRGPGPTSPARGRTSPATTSTRSTGTRRRASRRRAAPTSSSSARSSPRRRRASSSSRTVGRRWTSSPWLPWLSKPEAMAHARDVLFDAAVASRGIAGYLDFADGEAFWRPPRTQQDTSGVAERTAFGAPKDTLGLAFEHLVEHRRALPTGSFVFVLSDFLDPPPDGAWTRLLQQRWDVVPVVIQDPVWEQNFPPIGGVVVPFWDPRSRRVMPVRLTDARRPRAASRTRSASPRPSRSSAPTTSNRSCSRPIAATRSSRRSSSGPELRRFWRGRTW